MYILVQVCIPHEHYFTFSPSFTPAPPLTPAPPYMYARVCIVSPRDIGDGTGDEGAAESSRSLRGQRPGVQAAAGLSEGDWAAQDLVGHDHYSEEQL